MTVPPGAGKYFGFSDSSWLDPALQVEAREEADLVSRAGVNLHRVFFDWRYAEPARDVYNEHYFAQHKAFYDALRAREVRPLVTVALAPAWSWDIVNRLCHGESCRFPPARAFDAEWQEILRQVVRRFPDAAGIEIWNEPNLAAFWRNPDPKRYAELVRLAHGAIKGANPRMTVVAGALSGAQSYRNGDVPLHDFLAAAYRHGLKGGMDALSFHPYPWSLDLGKGSAFAKQFHDVRSAASDHGDAGRRLWVTEAGLSTTGRDPSLRFTEAEQAQGLLKLYRKTLTMPDVDTFVIHTLLEPSVRPSGLSSLLAPSDPVEDGYGVMRAGAPPDPKPAYCAFVREARRSHPRC